MEQLEDAVFDMVVAGRVVADGDVAIMMVEAESTESTWNLVKAGKTAPPTEDVVGGGLEAAKPFIKALCDAQAELAAQFPPKETAQFPIFADYGDDLYAAVEAEAADKIAEAMTIADKQERNDATSAIKKDVIEKLAPPQFPPDRELEFGGAIKALTKKIVRHRTLTEKVRIDGRGVRDIRTCRPRSA